MTGYNRKQIAEMIQRFVAGGNVSVDTEFYVEETYPIIDSLVVAYLSKQMLSLDENGKVRGKDAINEMWLKKTGCQNVVTDCDCGRQTFSYTMPNNYLPLPDDSGIYMVMFKANDGNGCRWDVANKSTAKNANTYLPSIAGIMPQNFYLQGLTIFLDYPATKIDVWNLPVTADLEDTDFVALPPVSEEQFQIMLHDYFAGRGNAPKDRIANQMDAKQ